MKKTMLLVGGKSAVAEALVPALAKEYKILTAGRHDCDVLLDLEKEVVVPVSVDVIVNLAADFGGNEAADMTRAAETNVIGLLKLCAAAHAAGVTQLVAVSSMSAVLAEDSPYYGTYAITKRQGDELADFYSRSHGLVFAALRPSQIYGNNLELAKHQPYFYHVVESARQGKDVTIYGSHDALRNYIHTDDLAEAIHRSIKRRVEGIFSCTYPDNVSYGQIARTAQEVFGRGGNVTFLKDKPNIPDNVFAQETKLYDMIDYTPRISLEKGLSMLKEYIQRGQE